MTFHSIPTSRPIMRSMPPGSTIKIGDIAYAPEGTDYRGTTLHRLDQPEAVEHFTWEDVALLRADGRWRYTPPPPDRTGVAPYSLDLTLLTPKARAKVTFMPGVLHAIHELESRDDLVFTDQGLADVLARILPKLAEAFIHQQFPDRQPRLGDHVDLPAAPSTRSIRRAYRKFVLASFDLRVLVRKPQPGKARSHFEPEVEELLEQGIREFGKEGGSDVRTVADNTQKMIKRVNKARLE